MVKISKKLKEALKTSFNGYLISKRKSSEEIFLIFSSESFMSFLSKFEPDIRESPFIKEISGFLKRRGVNRIPVLVVWREIGEVDRRSVYNFSTCELLLDSFYQREKSEFVFVVYWNETSLLTQK